MSCSATVLLEVGELVSLKVTNENYFGGKKCQNFTFLTLALRSRGGKAKGASDPPPPSSPAKLADNVPFFSKSPSNVPFFENI